MNNIFKALSGIVLFSLLMACARIGQPPGGPKDEDAPVVVKSKPDNYSTEYKRKNVYIGFDEFVTLKDVYTEFTISPPLEKTPIPRLKGKGVVVDLQASLLDSLTYTLDFGQSIADNNEGNPLPNFQFVISKQTHIDSFSVSGVILDSYTHQPDPEGLYVYLYTNLSDTIPYTTIPSYLGRTTPEGEFTINHIAPGTYAIFALKDANVNMLFDMPSEIIAFADEPVYLYPDSFPALPDTTYEYPVTETEVEGEMVHSNEPIAFSTTQDSIIIDHPDHEDALEQSDSTQTDSIEFMVYGYKVKLYSFLEEGSVNQYLSEYKRDQPERLEVIFNSPLDNLPELELLSPDTVGNWYLLESNPTLDTLIYWLPDSNLINTDSIVVAFTHPESDTTHNLITVTDTLLFRSKVKTDDEKESKRRGGFNLGFGKKDEEVDTLPKKAPRVKYGNNIKSNSHDLYLPIVITPEAPVFVYKPELIELYRLEDTLEIPVNFSFNFDSSHFRKSVIKTEFEPSTNYILKLHEGAFTDIYNRTIDSTAFRFKTQRDDYYGIVEVKMKNILSPTILQLLDKEEQLIKQVILYADREISFDYLNPGEYKLKVIFDDNNNGKWDTGEYKLKLQPERVDYFPTVMDVRSNWTLEYEWEME